MNKFWLNQRFQIAAALCAALLVIYAIWTYIASFQNVTFEFDEKIGYIEIIDSHKRSLFPKNNQSIRLAKGEYQAKNIGDTIADDSRSISINNTTSKIPVAFNFTAEHLNDLYQTEKTAIEATLLTKYPQITTTYDIHQGKLYHQGDIYGALLVARDQSGDNADTLRVLMQKRGDEWILRSKPPTPILSAPLYSDIDKNILRAINQAK